MSWKVELFRAFFVALGALEVITNGRYLLCKNGITLARKQHQEIPSNVTDKNMKVKVICMFISGIGFLLMGLASYVMHDPVKVGTCIFLVLFALYALIEAIYYKYINTFGFATISMLFLIIYIFLN